MADPKNLTICLLSDTTFGRGEGMAGMVDVEVEHDKDGLPFIGGKVLHGLLRDTWLSMWTSFKSLENAAELVLGQEAILDPAKEAILEIKDAVLPDDVQAWVRYAVHRTDPLRPEQILSSLTDIRRQTAQSRETGAPEETTLRASRVVVRGISFQAPLIWRRDPTSDEKKVLALCALGTRHGGLGRNRGRGFLQLTLDGDIATTRQLADVRSS